jgi:hypothetical protein
MNKNIYVLKLFFIIFVNIYIVVNIYKKNSGNTVFYKQYLICYKFDCSYPLLFS